MIGEVSGRALLKGPEGDRPDETLWSHVADLPERQRHAVVLKYVAALRLAISRNEI